MEQTNKRIYNYFSTKSLHIIILLTEGQDFNLLTQPATISGKKGKMEKDMRGYKGHKWKISREKMDDDRIYEQDKGARPPC